MPRTVPPPRASPEATTARLAMIARDTGKRPTRGMLSCCIKEPHNAWALVALTHGYVLVYIEGEYHEATWIKEKTQALAAWEELCERQRNRAILLGEEVKGE